MRGSSSDSRHPKNMEIAQLIKILHRESQQQYRRWHPFWFALTECQKHTNAQAQFYKRAFALLSLASRSYFALLRWRLGPSVSNRKQSGQYCHGWNVTCFRHCSYTCQRLLCDVWKHIKEKLARLSDQNHHRTTVKTTAVVLWWFK